MLRITEIIIICACVIFAGNLPDTNLTPGSSYKFVTLSDLCNQWYEKSVPNLSSNTKNRVFDRYGISIPVRASYVIDRLIPKSLGGNNSLQNLWPMRKDPIYNSQAKIVLGDTLNHLVCYGRLTIAEAQAIISRNWIEAYQEYVQKNDSPLSK
jgi:hypothetical protein